jgi:UDP-N-acetylmuramoyl-tripeptide--D-alanyl-D-alanine ligase
MSKLKITIEDLFELPSAEILNPDSFKEAFHVSSDSRNIKPGTLFVAIVGENFNGHDFVKEAVNKGAGAVVIENRFLDRFDNINTTIITVEDTTKAFGGLASIWRSKLKAKVVAVTGSNGKTSTKDMLASILSEKYRVSKSAANNNNHIGVPLTILNTDDKCEVLILEQGTNHFGEIGYSAKISRPDYALMTNIGDSHLEFLVDREGVYKEKSALFSETVKHKGVCFINNDDTIIKKHSSRMKNKVSFGFTGKPDVKGEILGYTSDGRPIIDVAFGNKEVAVELPLYGTSNAKNFLAVCTVAFKLGLTEDQIIAGVEKLKDTKGRMQAEKFDGFILFNDTYNSNPASVEAGIDVLENISNFTKKLLVLGDMLELGKKTVQLHKNLYKAIPNKKEYTVLTIGPLMEHLSENLKKNVARRHFDSREELKRFLGRYDFLNTAVLVKGSRGMKMEDFVNVIAERGK